MFKKFLRGFLYVVIFLAVLRACGALFHTEHDWQAATCTEPETCSSCGATQGEALGHDWQEATCLAPKTCARCGATEGARADHDYLPATCTEPETCSVCGQSPFFSFSLGHKWESATCTSPKTCTRCGLTEGDPLEHKARAYIWTTTVEATCQNEGEEANTCFYCGSTMTRTVPIADHAPGEWQVEQKATSSAPGVRVRYCTVCGEEVDRESYTVSSGSSSTSGSGGGNNFNTYNNEEQQNTSATYVLNTSSHVFHYPSCRDVPKIASKNYSTSSQSREEIIARGYRSCGHCHP